MSGTWIVTDIEPTEKSFGDHNLEAYDSENPVVPGFQENGGKGHDKTKWLSGAWPLKPFNEGLPPNKRKSEWFRFRDQFQRIASMKGSVDSETMLEGLKIHAGPYLVDIIEIREKMITERGDNIYNKVVESLNSYFNRICDPTKEKMTFKEMRMNESEPFIDWVLRLETQAKYCEFTEDERQQEFLLALLRRSIPAIGDKLYEMSEMLNRNIESIVSHGEHLDHIRREAEELNKNKENAGTNDEFNSVNVLRHGKSGNRPQAGNYSRKFMNNWTGNRGRGFRRTSDYRRSMCSKCAEDHPPNRCRAFRVKCHNCGRIGHFAKCCRAPPQKTKEPESSNTRFEGKQDHVKREINKINQVSGSDSD